MVINQKCEVSRLKRFTPKGLSIDIFSSLIGGGGAARNASFEFNSPPENTE